MSAAGRVDVHSAWGALTSHQKVASPAVISPILVFSPAKVIVHDSSRKSSAPLNLIETLHVTIAPYLCFRGTLHKHATSLIFNIWYSQRHLCISIARGHKQVGHLHQCIPQTQREGKSKLSLCLFSLWQRTVSSFRWQ
jgi:hypothetical protein